MRFDVCVDDAVPVKQGERKKYLILNMGKHGNGMSNTANRSKGETLGVVVHEFTQRTIIARESKDVMIAVKAIGFQLNDIVVIFFVHSTHPIQHGLLVLALFHIFRK